MSIPPDSPWRGCAAYFPQPVDKEAMLAAQCLAEQVYHVNCRNVSPPLHDIEYRSSSREHDTIHHVFRWDSTPYEEIFLNGFQSRGYEGTPDDIHCNLDHFVHKCGRPLDSRRPATHAFVSTTLSSDWYPSRNRNDPEVEVYRYEIYAPGGIWVAETLGDRYKFPAQDEVCFVAGIAPQYIRSAQLFRLGSGGSRYTRRERVNHGIIINRNFDPSPSSSLRIQRPVSYYMADDRSRRSLNVTEWPPLRKRRLLLCIDSAQTIDSARTDWYTYKVADSESYIDAAFRSSRTNEAYLFMKNEYVKLNYAPGTTDDRVLNGPLHICDGFPSLRDTAFGEHGIDCAFRSAREEDEAFIFSGNLCAVINYAPGTTDDRITKGPMTIIAMFPFLKGTVFENGVDAAFESTNEPEAYLFKGDQYALINYGPDSHLIHLHPITEGFPRLRSTIFESGIDAAFASHRDNEACIFKGDSYALINFAPGSTDDKVIGGVKKILRNWPSLRSILPRKNHGLDIHDDSTEPGVRDQDEF